MTNREERTVFVGQKVMYPHFFLFQEEKLTLQTLPEVFMITPAG